MRKQSQGTEEGARERLDMLLVARGLAGSRSRAKEMILAGEVYVDGRKVCKAGTFCEAEGADIRVLGQELRYVSRGGLKLEKALREWQIGLEDKICMDIGASTGGFTDCMLQNGAARVYALDVGRNQLAEKLKNDKRVVCMEQKNFRYMTQEELPEEPEFVSADVSFISLLKVIPPNLKFMKEEEMQAIYEKTGAKEGDVLLVIADTKTSHVLSQLGYLRTITAQKLGIVPQGMRNLLWITEMPFFEFDEDLNEWVAMHHPFTSPLDECLPYLETDKGRVRAKAYDLVMNGMELCSGSIRITDPELQGRIFALLGLSDEEAHEKFGFLLDAFRYGAPPHGGIGLGLDRLVMQMAEAGSMRDVVAYPKVQNMSELMTQAPAAVDKLQLDELGIAPVKAT